jgi:hypothetical protein
MLNNEFLIHRLTLIPIISNWRSVLKLIDGLKICSNE